MSKRRATYSKDLRATKQPGEGLVTISLEMPNKELFEEQRTIDMFDAEFVKWIMTVVFCDEVRELPDIQQIIREAVDARTATTVD